MIFSDFAFKLKEIIGGEKRAGAFVRELFDNMLDIPANLDENIMIDTPDTTFKAYFTGDRKLTRFAPKIRKYVEPELFVSYIDGQSPESQKDMLKEFSAHCIGMDDTNIPESMAQLFKDIIVDAIPVRKSKKKSKASSKETVSDNEIKETDFALLSECGMRCSLCKTKLVMTKKGTSIGRYKAVAIMPIGLDSSEKVPYEVITKPVPNLLSQDNQILLCRECAEEYELDPTPEEYGHLMNVKTIQVHNAKLDASIYDIGVEKGINLILESFSKIKVLPPKENKSKWKAFRVDKKITEDIMLQDSVTDNVLKYYRYIEAQFKQREREGKLRFNKIKNEISQCFELFDESDIPQQEIYDGMVDWMKEQTGCTNLTACSVMVSFFVQNCEVFYETTE